LGVLQRENARDGPEVTPQPEALYGHPACILVEMAYFLGFNAVMLLLAIGVGTKVVPVGPLTSFITGLHYTIGISTPSQAQVRRAVIIWIISMLVIVDLLFSLLVWVF
jgi:hypothetical protein